MDDGGHILKSPYVTEGDWHVPEWRWLPYLLWSMLYGFIQAIHPADHPLDLEAYSALFHALNLAVHFGVGCLVFFVGRDIFERSGFLADSRQRKIAALLGALIFACHPIGSEPVHYARCLMIDLVTLFSVVTAWGMFRFVKEPGIRWALVTTGALAGAAISKSPGIIHAAANVVIVGLATVSFVKLRNLRLRELEPRTQLYFAGCTGVLAILALAFALFWDKHFGLFHFPKNFGFHALTQGRLFWEYVARIVIPVNQAADHWVPWTLRASDPAAILGSIATFAVFAASAWLTIFTRHRLIGMLLALALAPLAMRFGYVVGELMVEYRVYPALPWIALLMGLGLTWIWAKKQVYGIAAAAVVLTGFVVACQQRSYLWSDVDKLLTNNVQQYPEDVRAVSLLQLEAFKRGDYGAVMKGMIDVQKAAFACFEYNKENPHRMYDANRIGQHWSEAHQYVVFAIAKRDGNQKAIKYADAAIQAMNQLYPGAYIDLETGEYVEDNPLVMARQMLVELAVR